MDKKYYAAPMEGLTTWLWRRVHQEMFGGMDKYFTPFVSPNANLSFQAKELRELTANDGLRVVPQILCGRADHFLWAVRELADMGYDEVDLNLGCPSGTVTAKGKGAGLLREPDRLEELLEGVFAGLPEGMSVSVKTRIGWTEDGEWPALLDIFNRYPISELIVHPRVRQDFYSGKARREVFAWTRDHTVLPVAYNGDVDTPADAVSWDVPVMIGRGLLADPALARRARGGPPASREELTAFLDALTDGYAAAYGDGPALHRMWELWAYLAAAFDGAEPYLKRIRKCKHLTDYRAAAAAVLENCPMKQA